MVNAVEKVSGLKVLRIPPACRIYKYITLNYFRTTLLK